MWHFKRFYYEQMSVCFKNHCMHKINKVGNWKRETYNIDFSVDVTAYSLLISIESCLPLFIFWCPPIADSVKYKYKHNWCVTLIMVYI